MNESAPEAILVLSDIRSCYNVGSIFRTADGLGATAVYLCGITPYPRLEHDTRPEKVIASNSKQIAKTALGAELSVPFKHFSTPQAAVDALKAKDVKIYALENQVPNTTSLSNAPEGAPHESFALLLGSETEGLTSEVTAQCDAIFEIPMHGIKNSLNVSVAAGIALYQLMD